MKDRVASPLGKYRIHLLAELLRYGIEWNRDLDPTAPGIVNYKVGGLETAAFSFACCVVQWFGADSCPVSDVMEGLQLDKLTKTKTLPTVKMLEKRITKFILSYE